jgi:hypothetical protein
LVVIKQKKENMWKNGNFICPIETNSQTNDDIAFLKSIVTKSLVDLWNISEIENHPDKFEAEKCYNVTSSFRETLWLLQA